MSDGAKVLEAICNNLSGGTFTCAVVDSGFDVKFTSDPLFGDAGILKAGVGVDICPTTDADYSPQLSFDPIALSIDGANFELGTPPSVKIFGDNGLPDPTKLEIKGELPAGVGELTGQFFSNPVVDQKGIELNYFVDVCYEFNGEELKKANDLLQAITTTEVALLTIQKVFADIVGKKFCSKEVADIVVKFHDDIKAAIDNWDAKGLTQKSAKTAVNAGFKDFEPIYDEFKNFKPPIQVFSARFEVEDFCSAESAKKYAEVVAKKVPAVPMPGDAVTVGAGMVTAFSLAAQFL